MHRSEEKSVSSLTHFKENSRSIAIKAIAKANGLELNIVHAVLGNPTAEHLAVNNLGRIPTFVDEDGFVLSECMAVALYCTLHPYLHHHLQELTVIACQQLLPKMKIQSYLEAQRNSE